MESNETNDRLKSIFKRRGEELVPDSLKDDFAREFDGLVEGTRDLIGFSNSDAEVELEQEVEKYIQEWISETRIALGKFR